VTDLEPLSSALRRELLDLVGDNVELSVRSAFARLGVSRAFTASPVRLSVAAAAGPAITWATARAAPPRVGTTAVGLGVILAAGVSAEYPSHAPVFALLRAQAATLVPRIRFQLGTERSEPLGRALVEVAFGLGARWDIAAP
jgi:hypothetical protein